jgi:uncharacterized membrane protein YgcG
MESFYGFIESRSERVCNRWPTDNWTSLRTCGFTFHHPGSSFWHANVRVLSDAARRDLLALAKIGQAGWKSYAQELLPPRQLHRWWLGAYASFLLAVARPNGTVSLGVHPFARTADGKTTIPWIHPALRIDLGAPLYSHPLLEAYQPAGHTSYVRAFERGVAVYNPHDHLSDRGVPLGGGGPYIDPWDSEQTGGCGAVTTVTLAPHEGRVLVKPHMVVATTAGKATHAAAGAGGSAGGGGWRSARASFAAGSGGHGREGGGGGNRRLFAKGKARRRGRAQRKPGSW